MENISHSASTRHTPLPMDDLLAKCEEMIQTYWEDYPDLYQIVKKKRQDAAALALENEKAIGDTSSDTLAPKTTPDSPLLDIPLRGEKLRARINESHRKIRKHVLTVGADIIPGTAAQNRKSAHQSTEEEREFRGDVLSAQIRSWRSMLPKLMRQFSKIPDYRRTRSITHKITVLMVFGLFAFIFRLSSRREMNRELTSPIVFEHLKRLFPEIDSIPHADTLARVLEDMDPKQIEAIHVGLIKDLITGSVEEPLRVNWSIDGQ